MTDRQIDISSEESSLPQSSGTSEVSSISYFGTAIHGVAETVDTEISTSEYYLAFDKKVTDGIL